MEKILRIEWLKGYQKNQPFWLWLWLLRFFGLSHSASAIAQKITSLASHLALALALAASPSEGHFDLMFLLVFKESNFHSTRF